MLDMKLLRRLQRLEDAVHSAAPPEAPVRLTEDDWLAWYEAQELEGAFAPEPDFPAALAFYRDALKRAQAQADPPFDPPIDFMPNMADLPDLRLLNWRTKARFPDVDAGWWWLAEIQDRVRSGVPPVTEAEFRELAAWFNAHDERLYRQSLPSQLLNLGGGRCTSSADVRYGLAKGPRAFRAGKVADDVRRLKAIYGESKSCA
jgi:hypothetical protein